MSVALAPRIQYCLGFGLAPAPQTSLKVLCNGILPSKKIYVIIINEYINQYVKE